MSEKDKPVRPLVDVARLPRKGPIKLWAGAGSGAPCARCGLQIDASDVEYEISMGDDGATTIRIHIECFAHLRKEIGA